MSGSNAAKGANTWLLASVALVYSGMLAWVATVHTFWRDEAEAWIVARDSHGWLDLLHNVRYEGHPAGWYALLFGTTLCPVLRHLCFSDIECRFAVL